MKAVKLFDGWKSYAGAGLIAAAALLGAAGLIPPDLAATLHTFGLSLLGTGLAHKLAKLLAALEGKNGG